MIYKSVTLTKLQLRSCGDFGQARNVHPPKGHAQFGSSFELLAMDQNRAILVDIKKAG